VYRQNDHFHTEFQMSPLFSGVAVCWVGIPDQYSTQLWACSTKNDWKADIRETDNAAASGLPSSWCHSTRSQTEATWRHLGGDMNLDYHRQMTVSTFWHH